MGHDLVMSTTMIQHVLILPETTAGRNDPVKIPKTSHLAFGHPLSSKSGGRFCRIFPRRKAPEPRDLPRKRETISNLVTKATMFVGRRVYVCGVFHLLLTLAAISGID
jgi:hypothetical protein